MWRTFLFLALMLSSAAPALAQNTPGLGPWQTCQGRLGAAGPELSACRPLEGWIDPQNRELWLIAPVGVRQIDGPMSLNLSGTAANEAWFNGVLIGRNGVPGTSAAAEKPGRYDVRFLIDRGLWRSADNQLVLRMSAFHVGAHFDYPVGGIWIGSYPGRSRLPLLAVTFAAAGALLAAAFGFGAVYAMRRTPSSLNLAALAGAAALQAGVENLRSLVHYAYPLHVWRIGAIWALSAGFALLLANYAAMRFWPKARPWLMSAVLAAIVAAYGLSGFDRKTAAALLAGVICSALAAGAGIVARRAGARIAFVCLVGVVIVGAAAPEWFLDLSFFLLAACLTLPLLILEVLRLGRADLAREQALTRAVSRPDRLAVTSAKGVELVPVAEIIAVVGADDYAELKLRGGRSLLHAARLEQLCAQLPPNFMRVHRSAIANLARVEALSNDAGRWRLILNEGVVLPVSRSRLAALRETLEEAGAAPALAAAQ